MTKVVTVTKVLVRRSSDGRYLLLRRSAWDERPDLAHQPDIPGGIVEPGESLARGSQRELAEETGFEVPELALSLVHMATYYYQPEERSVNRLLYLTEVDDSPVRLSWEHDTYEWCVLEDLLGRQLRPHMLEAINYAKQYNLLV